jgi:hypothetical protein
VKIAGLSSCLWYNDESELCGAYAYGRSTHRIRLEQGRKRIVRGLRQTQENWSVLILDHHEAYISWEEYEVHHVIGHRWSPESGCVWQPDLTGRTIDGQPRSRSLATALLRARFASGFRYVQLHHLLGHDLSMSGGELLRVF